MKFISWNVNGIRACVQKGFLDFFQEIDADIFCIQESKMQEGQLELDTPGYHQYWNYAVKKGYSGTAVFTKKEPVSVVNGIGIEEHDQEGRVITLEFENFYFVTVYTRMGKCRSGQNRPFVIRYSGYDASGYGMCIRSSSKTCRRYYAYSTSRSM